MIFTIKRIMPRSFLRAMSWALSLGLLAGCNQNLHSNQCYEVGEFGNLVTADIMVRADGNYSGAPILIPLPSGDGTTTTVNGQVATALDLHHVPPAPVPNLSDPFEFGKWKDTNLNLQEQQHVLLRVSGVVSMCQTFKKIEVKANETLATGIQLEADKNHLVALRIAGNFNQGTAYNQATPKDNKAAYQPIATNAPFCNDNPVNSQSAVNANLNCWLWGGQGLIWSLGPPSQTSTWNGVEGGIYKAIAKDEAQNKEIFVGFVDPTGNYADNKGGYQLEIQKQSCFSIAGKGIEEANFPGGNVQLFIGNFDPNSDSRTFQPDHPDTKIMGQSDLQFNSPKEGRLWLRITGDSQLMPYAQRVGALSVHIETTEDRINVSSAIDKIYDPIRQQLNGVSERMFNTMVRDNAFITAIRAMLLLYIVVYGLYFVAGLEQLKLMDVIQRIVRITIVSILISDTSWTFFNQFLFPLFRDSSDQLIRVLSGDLSNSEDTFAFLNKSFSFIFDHVTWIRLLALLSAPPLGLVYAAIMFYGIMTYIFVVIKCLIAYMIGLIGISFSIAIAPLFLPMMLFKPTQSLFNKWIGLIFNFSLQPVFLFAVLAILNELEAIFFHAVFALEVCWKPAFSVYLPAAHPAPLSQGLFSIYSWVPQGYETDSWWLPTVTFNVLLIYLLFTRFMAVVVDQMSLTVGILTSFGMNENISIATEAQNRQDKLKNKVNKLLGRDGNTKAAVKKKLGS
jgi:type IV secretory pathway VirB6-like protein